MNSLYSQVFNSFFFSFYKEHSSILDGFKHLSILEMKWIQRCLFNERLWNTFPSFKFNDFQWKEILRLSILKLLSFTLHANPAVGSDKRRKTKYWFAQFIILFSSFDSFGRWRFVFIENLLKLAHGHCYRLTDS